MSFEDLKSLVFEFFSTVWGGIVTTWNDGLFGIDISQIIIAVCVFFAFFVTRNIVSGFILRRLSSITSLTSSNIDDNIVVSITPAIKFCPIVLGLFVAAQFLSFDNAKEISVFIDKFVASLIIFNIFWAVYCILTPATHLFGEKFEKALPPILTDWIVKAFRIVAVIVGGAVIVESWGVAIAPLLAGFGLLGAAVALGAKDLFQNLIGGMTILAEKRFAPGDWIKVDGVVEGTVEEVGFRSTKLRRFDKAPVHVPNAKLSDAALTNFSRMTNRRISWKIGVTYSTTADQLRIVCDEIKKYLLDCDEFSKPPQTPIFVYVDSFSDSSIDIMIYCFTNTTIWGEWMEVKQGLAIAIKDIVENKAKTAFAFPSQSIYVETMPEIAAV